MDASEAVRISGMASKDRDMEMIVGLCRFSRCTRAFISEGSYA